MSNVAETAHEALRILRRIDAEFPDGTKSYGSGFLGDTSGEVITCAHVIVNNYQRAKVVKVNGKAATIKAIQDNVDLAILETSETDCGSIDSTSSIDLGEDVMFAGFPMGVKGPSVFSGILSARGAGLVSFPRCDLFQINGMINSGNSGGPVFCAGRREVIGVITAKHVPLLTEVDKLLAILKSTPQFPSEVGIGQIDFSKFVNSTLRAFQVIAGSLRLVQVGVGYAVPISHLTRP